MSAVYADGAMRGRAAVPSAAACRQDGGSPCGRAALRRDRRQDGGSPYEGAHYGEPPSRRIFAVAASAPFPRGAAARGPVLGGGSTGVKFRGALVLNRQILYNLQ